MAPKLILIGGIPCSGKTYIGKRIAKKTGIFVDKDTVSNIFTEEMLIALGSNANDREYDIYQM